TTCDPEILSLKSVCSSVIVRSRWTRSVCDRQPHEFAALNKSVQPVEARRGTGEQIGFLAAARALRHQLAGIPEDGITVGDFVDREVTLKHAARRSKGRDTGFNVGAESRGHLFGRWRFGVRIEAQGRVALTESAELDEHVWPGSEGLDR